jgi:hypothetical protein
MIYNVKKFRHYLLGNCFIFFVHHKTLLYLVIIQQYKVELSCGFIITRIWFLKSIQIEMNTFLAKPFISN